MDVDERTWALMQERLGYSDEEMALFRANPRNEDVLSKADQLIGKTMVAEVIESHGCNSQHRVGDKFYIDGAGNLISKRCPKRMCLFAMLPLAMLGFATHELIYAGIDPNDMRFKRLGCNDVGLKCGGWGRIVMELKIEERS